VSKIEQIGLGLRVQPCVRVPLGLYGQGSAADVLLNEQLAGPEPPIPVAYAGLVAKWNAD